MDFKTQLREFKQKHGFRTNKEGIEYFSNLLKTSPRHEPLNNNYTELYDLLQLQPWFKRRSPDYFFIQRSCDKYGKYCFHFIDKYDHKTYYFSYKNSFKTDESLNNKFQQSSRTTYKRISRIYI